MWEVDSSKRLQLGHLFTTILSQFVCSHQMIRSLPFDFVKQLKVGADTNLPQDFIKAVRNDASRAETNHIRSIQL